MTEDLKAQIAELEKQRNAVLVSILPQLQQIATLDAKITLLAQIIEQIKECPTLS